MRIIGMIHLETLPGFHGFKDMDYVVERALQDAEALEQGGVDAILIENTEDHPHTERVREVTVRAFVRVAREVRGRVKLPIGICVLWNDYRSALRIAKECGASFIRVPVFVDRFRTEAGIITGDPEDVILFRKRIGAHTVRVMADIHVKHAIILTKRSIEESARDALRRGADALIVTGRVTGDAPILDDLKRVRQACPEAEIVVGSGTTPQNIKELAGYANAAIVGTYFKTHNKIDPKKGRRIMSLAREVEQGGLG